MAGGLSLISAIDIITDTILMPLIGVGSTISATRKPYEIRINYCTHPIGSTYSDTDDVGVDHFSISSCDYPNLSSTYSRLVHTEHCVGNITCEHAT